MQIRKYVHSYKKKCKSAISCMAATFNVRILILPPITRAVSTAKIRQVLTYRRISLREPQVARLKEYSHMCILTAASTNQLELIKALDCSQQADKFDKGTVFSHKQLAHH